MWALNYLVGAGGVFEKHFWIFFSLHSFSFSIMVILKFVLVLRWLLFWFFLRVIYLERKKFSKKFPKNFFKDPAPCTHERIQCPPVSKPATWFPLVAFVLFDAKNTEFTAPDRYMISRKIWGQTWNIESAGISGRVSEPVLGVILDPIFDKLSLHKVPPR